MTELPEGCTLWNATRMGKDVWELEITPEHVVVGLASYDPVVVGDGATPDEAIANAIVELTALSLWAMDMAKRLKDGQSQG